MLRTILLFFALLPGVAFAQSPGPEELVLRLMDGLDVPPGTRVRLKHVTTSYPWPTEEERRPAGMRPPAGGPSFEEAFSFTAAIRTKRMRERTGYLLRGPKGEIKQRLLLPAEVEDPELEDARVIVQEDALLGTEEFVVVSRILNASDGMKPLAPARATRALASEREGIVTDMFPFRGILQIAVNLGLPMGDATLGEHLLTESTASWDCGESGATPRNTKMGFGSLARKADIEFGRGDRVNHVRIRMRILQSDGETPGNVTRWEFAHENGDWLLMAHEETVYYPNGAPAETVAIKVVEVIPEENGRGFAPWSLIPEGAEVSDDRFTPPLSYIKTPGLSDEDILGMATGDGAASEDIIKENNGSTSVSGNADSSRAAGNGGAPPLLLLGAIAVALALVIGVLASKKRRNAAAVLFVGCLFASGCGAPDASLLSSPVLDADIGTDVHLGSFAQGSPPVIPVTIINRTNRVWSGMPVTSSCSCLELLSGTIDAAPGESARVEVRPDTSIPGPARAVLSIRDNGTGIDVGAITYTVAWGLRPEKDPAKLELTSWRSVDPRAAGQSASILVTCDDDDISEVDSATLEALDADGKIQRISPVTWRLDFDFSASPIIGGSVFRLVVSARDAGGSPRRIVLPVHVVSPEAESRPFNLGVVPFGQSREITIPRRPGLEAASHVRTVVLGDSAEDIELTPKAGGLSVRVTSKQTGRRTVRRVELITVYRGPSHDQEIRDLRSVVWAG